MVVNYPAIYLLKSSAKWRIRKLRRVRFPILMIRIVIFFTSGRLSVDDMYNVVKLQNKIETTKDEIRKFFNDEFELDKDKNVSIKVNKKLKLILPNRENGRVLVFDRTFATCPSSRRRCSARWTATRTGS